MKRRLELLGLLVASALALSAGCPPQIESATRAPWSGQVSGTGGGGGGETVGPQLPAADLAAADDSASGTPATSTPEPEPAIVGGDVSGTTASSDAWTVSYPDCQEAAQGAFWRAEILRLVNQERQAQGVDPVTWNETLADQATQYACEMIRDGFFGHTNPITGSTLSGRAADAGYDFWIIGENLAAGQRSPAQVMADWMDSPCHRENVLNPAFTELGIGVRIGGDYGFYWVQEFGRPFALDPYDGPPYSEPGCTHE